MGTLRERLRVTSQYKLTSSGGERRAEQEKVEHRASARRELMDRQMKKRGKRLLIDRIEHRRRQRR